MHSIVCIIIHNNTIEKIHTFYRALLNVKDYVFPKKVNLYNIFILTFLEVMIKKIFSTDINKSYY